MKKQALLLIAFLASSNISAHAGCANASLSSTRKPAINFQAFRSALESALKNENTPAIICATGFSAVLFYIIYKFYVNGGYTNNPGYDWAEEKEHKSDYIKDDAFPATQISTPYVAQQQATAATQANQEAPSTTATTEATPVENPQPLEPVEPKTSNTHTRQDETFEFLRDQQLAIESY